MTPISDYSGSFGIPDISQVCYFIWGLSKEFFVNLSKGADLQLWASNIFFHLMMLLFL